MGQLASDNKGGNKDGRRADTSFCWACIAGATLVAGRMFSATQADSQSPDVPDGTTAQDVLSTRADRSGRCFRWFSSEFRRTLDARTGEMGVSSTTTVWVGFSSSAMVFGFALAPNWFCDARLLRGMDIAKNWRCVRERTKGEGEGVEGAACFSLVGLFVFGKQPSSTRPSGDDRPLGPWLHAQDETRTGDGGVTTHPRCSSMQLAPHRDSAARPCHSLAGLATTRISIR
jgi:hypothetical protein